MGTYSLNGEQPRIDETAYVAETATVIARVTLGRRSSVWSQCVLRADNEPIDIGEETNIQEGAVLHTDPGFPLKVGNRVSVGHQAVLHGCTIGDGSLIGIQAVVLNGAMIGRNCLVAAGAVVLEGKTFPDNSLILGAPAKVVREFSEEDAAKLADNADDYARRGQRYKASLTRLA